MLLWCKSVGRFYQLCAAIIPTYWKNRMAELCWRPMLHAICYAMATKMKRDQSPPPIFQKILLNSKLQLRRAKSAIALQFNTHHSNDCYDCCRCIHRMCIRSGHQRPRVTRRFLHRHQEHDSRKLPRFL